MVSIAMVNPVALIASLSKAYKRSFKWVLVAKHLYLTVENFL